MNQGSFSVSPIFRANLFSDIRLLLLGERLTYWPVILNTVFLWNNDSGKPKPAVTPISFAPSENELPFASFGIFMYGEL